MFNWSKEFVNFLGFVNDLISIVCNLDNANKMG